MVLQVRILVRESVSYPAILVPRLMELIVTGNAF